MCACKPVQETTFPTKWQKEKSTTSQAVCEIFQRLVIRAHSRFDAYISAAVRAKIQQSRERENRRDQQRICQPYHIQIRLICVSLFVRPTDCFFVYSCELRLYSLPFLYLDIQRLFPGSLTFASICFIFLLSYHGNSQSFVCALV